MAALQVKDIPAKLSPALQWARRYNTLIFAISLMVIYGFLVFRINSLIASEPAEDAITEKLKTVQRPRLDQEAVQKMQDLEDQNVQVQTLFDEARNNPFAE